MFFVNPYPRTWVEIELTAMADNLALIRERIGPQPILALVAKADAYGHGLIPVARFALQNGAQWICVATVQEGIALRDAGISQPILVLSPVLEVEVEQAVFYDLRLMVERREIAEIAAQAAAPRGREAIVHLKVDTGLSRFGCTPDEASELISELTEMPHVKLEGIAAHFADSGQDPERTQAQIAEFDRIAAREGLLQHLSNSAGAMFHRNAVRDLVRVGIAAFGIDPYQMLGGQLKPILSWKARVMSLRTRPEGTLVSYSGTYRCGRPTRIATLGVGYGDGYPRALSNGGFVMIHGRRALILGLVCMDQMMVDVTDIPGVQLGDQAELIGPDATVVELSKIARSNVHEIVTRIMSRVPRRYRHPH